MGRVAIVILNYLNYKDTIECVESILKMNYPICGVVLVDNGSRNGSYERLKKIYKKNKMITLIASKKNLGYARGNNLGINYARNRLCADYVLVVNNDTVFLDKEYITRMLDKYEPGVGVIGSKIILKRGCEAAAFTYYLGFKDLVMHFLNLLSAYYGSAFEFRQNQGKPVTILHGSVLMLTPDFFRKYKGFYKYTFLYEEEAILYLMCECANLRQVYVPEVKIYHKEDQSSLMSFQNEKAIIVKYMLQSKKHVIFYKIKYIVIKFLQGKRSNKK